MLCVGRDADGASESKWYPQAMPPIDRPPVPQAFRIDRATTAAWSDPQKWVEAKPNTTLAAAGVYDSRYVMYRTKVTLTADQAAKFKTLQLDMPANDPVIVRVNGNLATGSRYQRRETVVNLGEHLRSGENELVLLYENHGYPNFGPAIEQQAGITRGALTWSKTPDVMVTNWRVHLSDEQRPTATTLPSFDDSSWPSFVLDSQTIAGFAHPIQPGAEATHAAARILFGQSNARAVFRGTLELTDEMLANGQTQLVFERIDDQGIVYINGRDAGRSRNWERPLSIDGSNLLKAGRNDIAVVVTNRDGEGGLTRPVRLLGTNVERIELRWQLATEVPQPKSDWRPITLGSAASSDDSAIMSWYQIEFEMPEMPRGAWIPWLARINATGNGMIWLNGQHLGRYWQIGPQRDFFLPSCWLNFGPEKKNVLVLGLRPIDGPAQLQPIEIRPYDNAAEPR
jgi:hypothetical protein